MTPKFLLAIALIITGLYLILPIEDILNINLGGYSGVAWNEFVDFFIALAPLLFIVVGIILIFIEKQGIKSEPPTK